MPCVRTVRTPFERALKVMTLVVRPLLLVSIRLAIHYLLVNLMFVVMYRRYKVRRTRRLTWLVVQVVCPIGVLLNLCARLLNWCRVTRLLLAWEKVIFRCLRPTMARGVHLVSSPVVLRLMS